MPALPALFFGKFLNESKLQLLNLRQSFFRGKNLIKFSHAFSFPNKRISSNSVHELFFHFIFAFLSRNVHFLLRRGSDLHTPPWQWLLVRWDINNPPPFRPRPPARVPWFFNTKFALTSSELKSCTFSSKGLHFFFSVFDFQPCKNHKINTAIISTWKIENKKWVVR